MDATISGPRCQTLPDVARRCQGGEELRERHGCSWLRGSVAQRLQASLDAKSDTYHTARIFLDLMQKHVIYCDILLIYIYMLMYYCDIGFGYDLILDVT